MWAVACAHLYCAVEATIAKRILSSGNPWNVWICSDVADWKNALRSISIPHILSKSSSSNTVSSKRWLPLASTHHRIFVPEKNEGSCSKSEGSCSHEFQGMSGKFIILAKITLNTACWQFFPKFQPAEFKLVSLSQRFPPCWVLAAGCWLLTARCWLLGAGCWLLGARCSVLAALPAH